MLLFCVTELTV